LSIIQLYKAIGGRVHQYPIQRPWNVPSTCSQYDGWSVVKPWPGLSVRTHSTIRFYMRAVSIGWQRIKMDGENGWTKGK